MMVVVSYDVSTQKPAGRRRLRRVARVCESFGQRVQNSVFECSVDPTQWAILKSRLLGEIHPDEDSLRFYFLGRNWQSHREHHGTKSVQDPDDLMII